MIGHMKDRGSLIQLLDAFGIKEGLPDTSPEENEYTVIGHEDGTSFVVLGCGEGYHEFECSFHFDKDGTFLDWAVYE